jgi:hypothetical protein
MISKDIIKELVILRDALYGCPLELKKDVEFVEALSIIIKYCEDNEDDN